MCFSISLRDTNDGNIEAFHSNHCSNCLILCVHIKCSPLKTVGYINPKAISNKKISTELQKNYDYISYFSLAKSYISLYHEGHHIVSLFLTGVWFIILYLMLVSDTGLNCVWDATLFIYNIQVIRITDLSETHWESSPWD